MQIHQLNDFTGALGEGVFLPLDNGNDTGKIDIPNLFAGNSYTTLATGRISDPNESLSLSDNPRNHEFIEIYYGATVTSYAYEAGTEFHCVKIPRPSTLPKYILLRSVNTDGISSRPIQVSETLLVIDEDTVSIENVKTWGWTGNSSDNAASVASTTGAAAPIWVYRIDAIDTPINRNGVIKVATVTVPAANWSDSTQSVSVSDVTSSTSVLVTPAPSSLTAAMGAGVYCSGQSNGRLTFTCGTTPEVDLDFNVMFVG